MPELRQLSEGERPGNSLKYLLIEEFCEPGLGRQYRVSGQGCDLHREHTHVDLQETCKTALELARASGVRVVYLSCNCHPVQA